MSFTHSSSSHEAFVNQFMVSVCTFTQSSVDVMHANIQRKCRDLLEEIERANAVIDSMIASRSLSVRDIRLLEGMRSDNIPVVDALLHTLQAQDCGFGDIVSLYNAGLVYLTKLDKVIKYIFL